VLKNTYTSREADDIANLAFIGGKTNRAISDKPPGKYFSGLIEKAGQIVFDAQCIPTDTSLLDVPNYKTFLAKRRGIIAQKLNEFLGTSRLSDWPGIRSGPSPKSEGSDRGKDSPPKYRSEILHVNRRQNEACIPVS